MNKLFAFLLACVFAQFSYGQKELSIKVTMFAVGNTKQPIGDSP